MKKFFGLFVLFSNVALLHSQQAGGQPGRQADPMGGIAVGPIGFPELIIVVPIILLFLVIGLGIIASGQVFLAIREIALNTRKEDSDKLTSYGALFTVAKINNFLGWLIIIIGIVGPLLFLLIKR